jgi:hypothetical protein
MPTNRREECVRVRSRFVRYQGGRGKPRFTQVKTMNAIESIKKFILHVLSGKPAPPAPDPGQAGAEGAKTGSGPQEVRCINPDIGCSFDVS